MRKLLYTNMLFAVALSLFSLGCGGSPTAPTTAPNTQTEVAATVPTPAPSPSPEPSPPAAPSPDPVPAPSPHPVPMPSPAPTPVPLPPTWTFQGSTSETHWYGTPVLPDHFELEINGEAVQAAGHRFPILSHGQDNAYVIAGTRNVETLTLEYHVATDGTGSWVWTYNGLAGQANGTLERLTSGK